MPAATNARNDRMMGLWFIDHLAALSVAYVCPASRSSDWEGRGAWI